MWVHITQTMQIQLIGSVFFYAHTQKPWCTDGYNTWGMDEKGILNLANRETAFNE